MKLYVIKNTQTLDNTSEHLNCVCLNNTQYINLKAGLLIWKDDKLVQCSQRDFIRIAKENKPELVQLKANLEEMDNILTWLNNNDYIINKYAMGEYTDESPKWVAYKTERQLKLARYNELEKLI